MLTYAVHASLVLLSLYLFFHVKLVFYPLLWTIAAESISVIVEAWPKKKHHEVKDLNLEVTEAELAKHNTEESAWVAIHGIVYDVTGWLDSHPGGKEHLLLVAGRDCTDMFESYHPMSFGTPRDPTNVLPKFKIGKLAVSKTTKFPVYAKDSGLYKEMREKVAEYFKKTGKDPKDPMAGLIRMSCVVGTAAIAYYVQYTTSSLVLRVLACAVFGACQALPLLHVMHDASHTAITHSEIGWKWIGRFFMDWYAGASMTSWHNQHVIGHHIHTNVMDYDPDLPVDLEGDIRRLVPKQFWTTQYQYQHLYLLPLYGFLGLKFRIQDIMCTFLSRANGPIPVNPISMLTWSKQVASKLNFLIWRVVFPLYYFHVTFFGFLGIFLLTELVTGWYLALNFQVSHVSVACDFPESEDVAKMEWAKLQIVSSVDYAHGNAVMTFLCGALNYQTVHHLFPSVSQYHYPAIANIVMDVCKKRNVKFNKLNTFWDALNAHVELLRKMGADSDVNRSRTKKRA